MIVSQTVVFWRRSQKCGLPARTARWCPRKASTATGSACMPPGSMARFKLTAWAAHVVVDAADILALSAFGELGAAHFLVGRGAQACRQGVATGRQAAGSAESKAN